MWGLGFFLQSHNFQAEYGSRCHKQLRALRRRTCHSRPPLAITALLSTKFSEPTSDCQASTDRATNTGGSAEASARRVRRDPAASQALPSLGTRPFTGHAAHTACVYIARSSRIRQSQSSSPAQRRPSTIRGFPVAAKISKPGASSKSSFYARRQSRSRRSCAGDFRASKVFTRPLQTVA